MRQKRQVSIVGSAWVYKKLAWLTAIQAWTAMALICVWLIGNWPAQVDESYLQAAFDKKQLLSEPQTSANRRFVLFSGSSVAFSLSSELLERRIGLPVVNLGLHGGFSYEDSWRFFRTELDPSRDIIILSPEYENIQLAGDYSKVTCEIIYLSRSLPWLYNRPACVPLVLRQVVSKQVLGVETAETDSLYTRSNFNTHGDFTGHYGTVPTRFLPNKTERPSQSRIDQFIEFVRREMIARGFEVLYVPTAIAQQACNFDGMELKQAQEQLLKQLPTIPGHLDIPLCYPDEFFFDTTYHMNIAGLETRTNEFTQLLTGFLRKFPSAPSPQSEVIANHPF